jgi:hypothetical protein
MAFVFVKGAVICTVDSQGVLKAMAKSQLRLISPTKLALIRAGIALR